METEKYTWIPFFEELANKLLKFKNDRIRLIEKVKEAHRIIDQELPEIEKDNHNIPDIDPFTVIALFNRGTQGTPTRQLLCEGYKKAFALSADIPADFDGVPKHFYTQFRFYRYVGEPKREECCFDHLWELLETALEYADHGARKSEFERAFENARKLPAVTQKKLTMGLFHIRPNIYVSLDSNNISLIEQELNVKVGDLSGADYFDMCKAVAGYSKTQLGGSLPDFSERAYEIKQRKTTKTESGWEPSLEQYNPNLSKQDWLNFMQNSGKFSENYKFLLASICNEGGQATWLQLNRKYGRHSSHFSLTATHFAEQVQEFTNCPTMTGENGKAVFWPIPFVKTKGMQGEDNRTVWKLRPELKEAIDEYDLKDFMKDLNIGTEAKKGKTMIPKNTILYGPPGTGKTYHTAIYAVAIIENKEMKEIREENYEEVMRRYNEYKEQGLIEFTTFHQSYGYEEFIEGIRPVMADESEENSEIQYQISPGLFQSFCERAARPVLKKTAEIGLNDNPTVWKVSLQGTGENLTRTECMENGHIRIGYDGYGENITDETELKNGKTVLNAFITRMKIGDIVFSCYSATTIDAIGVVTGDYEWHDEYKEYKRLRKVKWLVKGIREDITEMNAGKSMTLSSTYALNSITLGDVMELLNKVAPSEAMVEDARPNHVFIIDEINRGNISKIFGELITLIEPTKRIGHTEGMTVKLPYSQKLFGVPDNVYLLGTMNTADRSIATLDTALRRRFRFKEMQPNPELLDGVMIEGLSVRDMLDRMNKKISILYDREHTIGHAYFMPLKEDPTVEALGDIFSNSILPLLQEYFYEDYEKIRLVLGDTKKASETDQFIIACTNDYSDLFGAGDIDFDESMTYKINPDAFNNIDAYRMI